MNFKDFFEMARAFEVKPGTILKLDHDDLDFVRQAQAAGVSPGSAIRYRYTDMLKQKPKDGDTVLIQGSGRGKKAVRIERMHLDTLLAKLQELGLPQTAEQGLESMNRQDGDNFLKRGFLNLNGNQARNAHVRNTDWEAVRQAAKDDEAGDPLDHPGIRPVTKHYLSRNRDRVEKQVAGAVLRIGNHCISKEDPQFPSLFTSAMLKVLLLGHERAPDDGQPLITHANWVHKTARDHTGIELRKLYGSDWARRICGPRPDLDEKQQERAAMPKKPRPPIELAAPTRPAVEPQPQPAGPGPLKNPRWPIPDRVKADVFRTQRPEDPYMVARELYKGKPGDNLSQMWVRRTGRPVRDYYKLVGRHF